MKLELNRVECPMVFEVTNEVGAKCTMDASVSIGGKDKGLRPMELLASGLAGCVAIDVLLILEKQRMDTELFKIDIEGKRVDGIPAPFESIQMTFEVDASVDKEKLSKNIQLVLDKYCSVSASLKEEIKITYVLK